MRQPVALLLCAPLLAGAQTVRINGGALKLFRPLPAAVSSAANPITGDKVALGRVLYMVLTRP